MRRPGAIRDDAFAFDFKFKIAEGVRQHCVVETHITRSHHAAQNNVLPLVVHHNGTLGFNDQIAAGQHCDHAARQSGAKRRTGSCLPFPG